MAANMHSQLCLFVLASAVMMRAASNFSIIGNITLPIYAFGDSLTDDGNTFNFTNDTYPPLDKYWQGRFSSAPGTWADITTLAGLPITNFAYGAATACNYSDIDGMASVVPSMTTVVNTWLANATLPSGSKVVVLWGGHNDIMSAVEMDDTSEALKVPAKTVECLIDMADNILGFDDQITLIMMNLAPIEDTPAFRDVPLIGTLIDAMNDALEAGATALGLMHGRSRVQYWDVHALMVDTIDNYQANNFTYGNNASCLPYNISIDVAMRNLSVVAGVPCTDDADYLFYDPIHPTSKGHVILANAFISRLADSNFLPSVPSNLTADLMQVWNQQRANLTTTTRRLRLRHRQLRARHRWLRLGRRA